MNKSGIVLLVLACGVGLLIGSLYSLGSADLGEQDRQPIPFSHEFHAGQLRVNCLFCHRHAEVSPVAGIPSVKVCMSCHDAISSETADLRKLNEHWEMRRPIRWVRLQRLPDFVYFTHEMHLDAGIRCMDCHGAVDQMRSTPRAATYEMGWCLTCHRQRDASQDCWTCHK